MIQAIKEFYGIWKEEKESLEKLAEEVKQKKDEKDKRWNWMVEGGKEAHQEVETRRAQKSENRGGVMRMGHKRRKDF